MPWPLSQDYNEAIQNPAQSFADPELKQGEAVCNALGLPVPCSGNFADVYAVQCGSRKWAVKCFTREIPGLQERYVQISKYLKQVQLPFMVEFTFLEKGIQVRGQWFPVLKMQWVEGFQLNTFVRDNLDKPQVLQMMCQIWARLAAKLREANLAHGDLQHGNVLLVPGSKAGALGVRLVDYDGMCVPALELLKSIEVGHPCYQHPVRLKEGGYSLEIDRFSHLVIYTALRVLSVGGKNLWSKFDNGDNLLFTPKDFEAPGRAPVFQELLRLNDPEVRRLVQALSQAAQNSLNKVPLLSDLLPKETPARAPAAKPAGAVAVPTAIPVTAASAFAGVGAEASGRRSKYRPRSHGGRWLAAAGVTAAAVLLAGVGLFVALKGPKETGKAVAEAQTIHSSPKGSVDSRTQSKTTVPATPREPSRPAPEPKKEQTPEPKKEPDANFDPPDLKLSGKCLRFRGQDFVELANTKDMIDLNGSFTIEMWVRLRSGINYLIGDESTDSTGESGGKKSCGFVLRTAIGERDRWIYDFTMATTSRTAWWTVAGPLHRPTDRWEHLAVCKTAESVMFFFNGKLYASKQVKGEHFLPCPSNVYLGVRRNPGREHEVNADIRAVRICNQALYTQDFSPPKVLSRIAGAMLLFDFASDNGNQVQDLSGHERHGNITRAEWVDVDAAWAPMTKQEPKTEPDLPIPVGELRRVMGNPDGESRILFSPDGQRLISGGNDGSIRIWEVKSGKELLRLGGHQGQVSGLLILDARHLFSGGNDGTIRLWELDKGTAVREVGRHKDWCRDLALSGDRRQILSVSGGPGSDFSFRVWDIETGKEVASIGKHTIPVVTVAPLPGGRTALCGYDGGAITLWDLQTRKAIRQFIGHQNHVYKIVVTADGRFAISASADLTLRLWDVASGKELHRFKGHTDEVESVALSPDGKRFLSSGRDCTLRLWDIGGRRLLHQFGGHTANVRGLAFSPDGRTAASASDDGTIRIWGLPRTDPATLPKADSAPQPGKEQINSIGMKLAKIPAGKFTMGSPKDERDRQAEEEQHEVEITRPFWIGVYHVTQEQYEKVMGDNPSRFRDSGNQPVDSVSWQDANAFCAKLSALPDEMKMKRRYRLPTEAEWEYACRGGADMYSAFSFGDTISTEQANFNNKVGKTTPVGTYKPNAFGLYDMHGNLNQWCEDWYGPYDRSKRRDPTGPATGTERVWRGGSWAYYGPFCRSAYRFKAAPNNRDPNFGFRVVIGSP